MLLPHRTRDKFGRLLNYVYLPDGRMLNRVLIEEGPGFADPRFNHPHIRPSSPASRPRPAPAGGRRTALQLARLFQFRLHVP